MEAFCALLSFILVVLVPASFSFGLTDCECKDYYGSCKSEGAEWTDDETWTYQCSGGQLNFIGCVASERGENRLIPVGESLSVNGFWHMCGATKRKLKYDQEPHCEYGGKEYHVGETYRLGDAPFERICQNWGIGITGCFYKDEAGEEKLMGLGETATVGLIIHHCSVLTTRPGRVQYWTSLRTDVTIATPTGKGESQAFPASQDILNFLPQAPKPWLLSYVGDYIRMDGFFRAKIRYLD